ncbi:MAG TPA: MBL fold metallo-hydrolase [Euzebyales bacterium]
MKLEFFNAADGDAFLASSGGRHLLVDGGRKGAFVENVLPRLDALRRRGEGLDAVCVSHIDADHITGILGLFELLIDWKVFDYHATIGNSAFPEPSRWRPPDVARVWHNGFEAQTGMDGRAPIRVLQRAAVVLAASDSGAIREAAESCGGIATSISQGIELASQLEPGQLDIPCNPEFGGGSMVAEPGGAPLALGDALLTVLGPTREQLEALKTQWETWVAENRAAVDALLLDADRHGLAMADVFFTRRAGQAAALADRTNVTVPNLASIMFLVREGARTALLTGDGFGGDVVTALEAEGVLRQDAGLHVDVLKVPHHGSEHNSDHTFYERITADHYVIPSDGSHHNPDNRVIDAIIGSRVGEGPSTAPTPQVGDPFTIWVTASTDGADSTDRQHLRQIRERISGWQRDHPASVRAEFVADASFVLDLE